MTRSPKTSSPACGDAQVEPGFSSETSAAEFKNGERHIGQRGILCQAGLAR